MAEVLRTFEEPIATEAGRFRIRVCGREREDGRWEGWIEFEPEDGTAVLRSESESVQPNRADLVYWAGGLRPVYAEGALSRTIRPKPPLVPPGEVHAAYRAPAPAPAHPARAVLDPFALYEEGPDRLRRRLLALSPPHLVRILRAYRLVDEHRRELEGLTREELVALALERVGFLASPSRPPPAA